MTCKAPKNAMPSYAGGKLTYADVVTGEGMHAESRLTAVKFATVAAVTSATQVPEASGLALLGLGAAGVSRRRRAG